MFVGAAMPTVAIGLLYTLDLDTSSGKWIGSQILAGSAIAFSVQSSLKIAQANVGPEDISAVTAKLYCAFVGALIDNHANGKHFNSVDYDVLWAKACALDVPIYLHPTWPSSSLAEAFIGAYPEPIGITLGGPGWGWHGDVGLHILKLFCTNVFDRFPTLKIIIGHMGEMLPFMLERCYDMSTRFTGGWGPRNRPLRQVWDENIWITTSGEWSLAPIKCIARMENTKVERIMYGVDYPFESNEKGRE
ncbi:hypothetical protein JMJ35_007571 [Cladonia borealis]|uniref:Amidohydrolase-related domain-containing protein n=1 Tax=Cladonia borealis TaxID=184061 RepID=A0AA39UZV5_9LECA|nr:hypothetical protein JMJ35_007571 [Cladonia borealis]